MMTLKHAWNLSFICLTLPILAFHPTQASPRNKYRSPTSTENQGSTHHVVSETQSHAPHSSTGGSSSPSGKKARTKIISPRSCQNSNYDLFLSKLNGKAILHIQPKRSLEVEYVARECTLSVLPKGTKLYHWGNDFEPSDQDRKRKPGFRPIKELVAAGKIINDDYETAMAMEDPSRKASSADNGVYWSTHIWDSHGYGNRLLISVLQEPVQLVDPQQCTPEKPEHEDLLNLRRDVGAQCLRDLGIVGTHQSNAYGWLFTIDERGSSNLKEATSDDFLSDEGMGLGSCSPFCKDKRSPYTVFDYVGLDDRYPLPENNLWLKEHAPIVYKLRSGVNLTKKEASALEGQIDSYIKSYEFDRNILNIIHHSSSPLAIHLRTHSGILEKLKVAIDAKIKVGLL